MYHQLTIVKLLSFLINIIKTQRQIYARKSQILWQKKKKNEYKIVNIQLQMN